MKLRNKKTGKIIDAVMTGENEIEFQERGSLDRYTYSSLAELNEEWEDYKEPKDIWWLDNEGIVNHASGDVNDSFRKNRKIGNYFLSQEEAEKAIEKLKAWKRLKDKGFRVLGWEWRRMPAGGGACVILDYPDSLEGSDDFEDDLDLLFSGEEF